MTVVDDADSGRPRRRSARRVALRVLVGLVVLVVIAGVLAYLGRDRIIDAAVRRQLAEQPDPQFLADDGQVRVLLCGTASPELSDARAQACTLVSAGGRMFLFDAGAGATKSLNESGVDLSGLSRVFLTHFHSDHFNGLGTLVNESWVWGRTAPLEVAGPPGTERVVEGIGATYALDTRYRTDNMPELDATSAAAAEARPVEIDMPDGDSATRVYDEDGVTIDAVRVSHEPVEPAYGYVLTYDDTKVFVSGDTRVTERTMPAMQDADIVVHEAYAAHLVERAIPIMRELGQDFDAEVAERTRGYHADTIELAKQAQAAGVEHLVLTHLIPYPSNLVARHLFVDGMSEEYDGELTLGRDGMVIVD